MLAECRNSTNVILQFISVRRYNAEIWILVNVQKNTPFSFDGEYDYSKRSKLFHGKNEFGVKCLRI